MTSALLVADPQRAFARAARGRVLRLGGRLGRCAKLSTWLREPEVGQLEVCGIGTDYCVRATALDAGREGFKTTVLMDLSAAVAPTHVPEISAELAAAGVAIKDSA